MSLHDKIMALQVKVHSFPSSDLAYQTGCHDGLCAAAELALKADALAVVAREVLSWRHGGHFDGGHFVPCGQGFRALDALAVALVAYGDQS